MLGESGRFEAHFPRVLEKISRVLGADVVAVFLLDKAGRELIVKAVHGLAEETASGLRMKIGEKVVGGAVSRKKPLVFEQKSLDELRKSNQWISIVNPQASIFSPMVIKGKVLGVLNVNYRAPHNFSTEEINFLWATAEHLALVIDDIVLYRNLEFLSTRDSLTRLYNRGHLHQHLDEELSRAERYNSELSLILLDIDHFKEYNDLYGHVLGDEFLQQIATLIQENIREVDFAARYGGEEFTIMLPNTGKSGALTLAERIRRVVAEAKFPGGQGQPVHKTISLGVATYPEDARNGRGLISRADQAMYQAKRQGRNQVQPYQKKWREKGERK
jgi:diguanylate cyclase (GGDEF)-like protein